MVLKQLQPSIHNEGEALDNRFFFGGSLIFFERLSTFSLLNREMFHFGCGNRGVEADRGEQIGGVAGKLI